MEIKNWAGSLVNALTICRKCSWSCRASQCMRGSSSCLCSIVRLICLWVVRAGCVSAQNKDVLFPVNYLMRLLLHTVLKFSIRNVYKPLSMQLMFLHCQHLCFLTLCCLRLSKGSCSLFHNLQAPHPTFWWVSCSAAWLLGLVASHQDSLLLTPGSAVLLFLKRGCPCQHLQEWSTYGALLHAVGLPTPALLLPHGYFSARNYCACSSWQLPLLLTSHKCSSLEVCVISW